MHHSFLFTIIWFHEHLWQRVKKFPISFPFSCVPNSGWRSYLLSGPQCCPRNRKILHQMTVNYKYGPVIHFQRMENVAFLKTSRCSFNQNCSNMSKSLVLWSRFGSFGEKTTWGSAEIHNIRFMAILCNFWLKIILVKNCTLLEILTHCAGRKRRSPLWFPSNYQEKFAFCWYLLLLLLLCGDFQQREKEGMVSSCVQNFDPSVSAAAKDQMYFFKSFHEKNLWNQGSSTYENQVLGLLLLNCSTVVF